MIWSLAGIVLTAASFVGALGCVAWAGRRLARLQRRIDASMRKPAVRALDGLQAKASRIAGALARLEAMGRRFDVVSQELLAASEAGARIGLDVRLVAATTEELLDVLVPSMRGRAA